MDENIIVSFKSIPEFAELEESGAKNNTVRKIDNNDIRFKLLRRGCKRLQIVNTSTLKPFERYVTSYVEWEGLAIISWRVPDGAN